jgi:hypothetical protein
LREVAAGIAGCEDRAHIVLSGHHSDWEFRRDLPDLERMLPPPPPAEALAQIDTDELKIGDLRQNGPS